MARYGYDFYGVGFYGTPVFVEFDASPVDAQAVDYGKLLVSWRTPTGSWSRLRLVRDSFGYPPTPDSGAILVDTAAGDPVVSYLDTDPLLSPEQFYYYSVFVRADIDGLWRRAGDTTGLMVRDWGYSSRLFQLTPTVHRNKDAEQAPFRVHQKGPLERFLTLFGFALDNIRTEYETLKQLNDPTQVAGGLLPAMSKQWGFGFETELGMRLSRLQLRNAVHLYKLKGTRLGVEGVVSVLTGWAPVVDHGRNLMLDQNEASFEQGLGTWTAGAGTPQLSRRNVATEPTVAGPVPVPAGASLGDMGSGSWLLELTTVAAGDQSIVQTSFDPVYYSVPVVSGRQYVFSAHFRPDAFARNAFVRLHWYDRNGVLLSTLTGAQVTEVANNWVRASVSGVAPANAAGAYGEPVIVAAGTGERHWIDALQIEEAPSLNPYESARDIRITLLADRINKIKNPSIEVNASEWDPDNATLARSTAFSLFGAASLSISVAVAGISGVRPPRIPVIPGTAYTFSYYIRPDVTARSVQAQIQWWNAAGTVSTVVTGSTFTEVVGSFVRVHVVSVAPFNAMFARPRVRILSEVAAEVHYMDGALFEKNYRLNDYFDGSTVSDSGEYVWEGAAHLSPSHYYSRRLIKNFRLNERLKDFLPAASTYTLLYAQPVDFTSTPALVAGLKLWLQGNTLDLSSEARVGTWTDSSGLSNNGTQGTVDSQPRKIDNVLNGHPVVRFDGINDHFSFPDFLTGLASGEVFIVVRPRLDPNPTAARTGLWDMGSESAVTSHFPWTDGIIYDEFGTTARKATVNPLPSLANWRLYNVRSATNAWSSHLDGVQLFTTATNTVGWAAAPVLGGSPPYYFDGDIAEVLIYGNVLSATDRTKITDYIERKYRLAIA